MAKKIFCVLMATLFLLTVFMIINTPLQAKEKKQKKDEEDEYKYLESLTLEELLNLEITTASRQKEKISDIPASVVVVTREDIETYGYQSLVEILENIPGLFFINDYTTESFGVRDSWTIDSQRNLIILVNDIQ